MTTVFTLRMSTAAEASGNFRGLSPARRVLKIEGTSLAPIGAPRAPVSIVTREELEAAISGLIDILDVIDRDADLEDDGSRKPSLGWTTTMAKGNRLDPEEPETAASRPS